MIVMMAMLSMRLIQASSLAVTFAFAPFPLTDHDCDHGEEADSGLQRMVLAEKR